MRRVLHIMPGFGGGIASFVINIIKTSNPSLIINDVASFTNYPDFYKHDVESKGGKAITLNRISLIRLLDFYKELKSIISKEKYDVLYIHDTDLGAFLYSSIARFCGLRRIIVHSHQTNHSDNNGLLQHLKFRIYKYITVACASQLASCSKMASAFRFGSYYVNNHRVMHLPNSININTYQTELTEKELLLIRQEIGLKSNELFIGHVGAFRHQKNHPFMVNLASERKKRGIKFKLVFIGVGCEMNAIIELVRAKELDDYVKFLGQRNDIASLFKAMDVSILPSFFEGLPTVAVECQAAGTPIVLSDTITDEVDMDLGITNYVSLKNIDGWIQCILESASIPHIDSFNRIKNIENRYFSSEKASDLFYKFINQEVSSYNLGEILL